MTAEYMSIPIKSANCPLKRKNGVSSPFFVKMQIQFAYLFVSKNIIADLMTLSFRCKIVLSCFD